MMYEALEMMTSAQINLNNILERSPLLAKDIMFQLIQIQIKEAVISLRKEIYPEEVS